MSMHVMLDLETFSVQPDAAIISIGAVKFDPYTTIGVLGDSGNNEYTHFYANVELHDVVTVLERKVDGQTLAWWLDQPQETRDALKDDPVPLNVALSRFWEWFGPESLPTWGNGAGFDNVILRRSFEALGGVTPFKFYHDRCFRTLKAMFPGVEYVKPEHAHHALSDAAAQAVHLQKIFSFLTLKED